LDIEVNKISRTNLEAPLSLVSTNNMLAIHVRAVIFGELGHCEVSQYKVLEKKTNADFIDPSSAIIQYKALEKKKRRVL